ncbi:antibiotic biosynthesis monooxygenase [Streptacidiphilus sp. ASG 303]|uniref:antibiotic biosynthesis monooxygenase n=1 Tax=Streptacidiphilus sp. ASG 303 TaxID=2896847 RepID=UPI001E58FA3F|nr:antibiotic biosynthesis monooxygenase [Streptacidiphilus sp. ASG 303]MCD0484015.1 antibiotic biosynthesis monooxygenase [Streptacidiphilus sp. ASG 303]
MGPRHHPRRLPLLRRDRGVTWLRPQDGTHHYHAVLHFRDARRLAAWMESPERAAWHARVADIAVPADEQRRHTGLDTWFPLPPGSEEQTPRWKMCVVTFCGAYPFSLLFQGLAAPHTVGWPLALRAAAFPLLLVPLLTYLVLPALNRLLRRWLYPLHPRRTRRDPPAPSPHRPGDPVRRDLPSAGHAEEAPPDGGASSTDARGA